jgi:PKHD-type hydroxylase
VALQVIIDNILSPELVAEFVARANVATEWVDGSLTSRGDKHCMFLDRNSTHGQFVISETMKALTASFDFEQYALPLKITPPMLVRYATGDYYKPHVDAAKMGDLRTDIAGTIFLTDGYTGGELILGEESIVLTPGQAYVYPANMIHEVTQVTSGARLVIVFWVQSNIRSNEQRELLAQMMAALWELDKAADTTIQLSGCYNNLYRMWSEQ